MVETSQKAAVLGWPIQHSRSPLIHNYWLKTYGIVGSYEKIAVDPKNFETFIRSMPDLGFIGANLTIPHKEAIFALADEVDHVASTIGAANTIWWDKGKLHATNTDVTGFMTNLKRSAPDWDKHNGCVAVIGAGGAARGIVYGLLQAGVEEVRIFNRTRERGIELSHRFDVRVKVEDWDNRNQRLADCHTLVNTTSLGMEGNPPLDIDLTQLGQDAVVVDIVYSPLKTPLLAQARKMDLVTVDGLGMLLHQAAPGFTKWFGRRPGITADLRALVVSDLTS